MFGHRKDKKKDYNLTYDNLAIPEIHTQSDSDSMTLTLRILYIQNLPRRKRTSPMMWPSQKFISGKKNKKLPTDSIYILCSRPI